MILVKSSGMKRSEWCEFPRRMLGLFIVFGYVSNFCTCRNLTISVRLNDVCLLFFKRLWCLISEARLKWGGGDQAFGVGTEVIAGHPAAWAEALRTFPRHSSIPEGPLSAAKFLSPLSWMVERDIKFLHKDWFNPSIQETRRQLQYQPLHLTIIEWLGGGWGGGEPEWGAGVRAQNVDSGPPVKVFLGAPWTVATNVLHSDFLAPNPDMKISL